MSPRTRCRTLWTRPRAVYRLTAMTAFLLFPLSAQAAETAASHFQRGLQMSLDNNWKGAEAEYRIAVQMEPKNVTYRSYLSDALAAQGKFEKAGESVKQEKAQIKKGDATKVDLKKIKKENEKKLPVIAKNLQNPTKGNPSTQIRRSDVIADPHGPPMGHTDNNANDNGTNDNGTNDTRDTKPVRTNDGPGQPQLPDYMTGGNGSNTIGTDRNGTQTGNAGNDTNEGEGNPALDHALELYEAEKYSQAETEYRKVARTHPESDEAWSGLGDTCYHLEKWAEAEKAYRQASKLVPDESYYHAQIAFALLKSNRRAEATKEAQIAKQMGLQDHEVFDELGMTR